MCQDVKEVKRALTRTPTESRRQREGGQPSTETETFKGFCRGRRKVSMEITN